MKPLSPVLFLTAVQAVTLRTGSTRDPDACTFEFVQEMGRIAHLSPRWSSTSWPFDRAATLDQLVDLAARLRMLRRVPLPGDLAVLEGRRVGVVLDVLEHAIELRGAAARCSIALAVPDETTRHAKVNVQAVWCGNRKGDLFVRWYEVVASARRAA